MRGKALEDGAMACVVEHLRLALEVFEARWRAELGSHVREERRNGAVSALMPVVISPGVADGPAVGLGNKCLHRFERGHAGDAKLDAEAAIDAVVGFERLKLIRPGVAQDRKSTRLNS